MSSCPPRTVSLTAFKEGLIFSTRFPCRSHAPEGPIHQSDARGLGNRLLPSPRLVAEENESYLGNFGRSECETLLSDPSTAVFALRSVAVGAGWRRSPLPRCCCSSRAWGIWGDPALGFRAALKNEPPSPGRRKGCICKQSKGCGEKPSVKHIGSPSRFSAARTAPSSAWYATNPRSTEATWYFPSRRQLKITG